MADHLNPQPEPPGGVRIGSLTHEVTVAIQSALAQHSHDPASAAVFRDRRIIIGVIFEPQALQQAGQAAGHIAQHSTGV